MVKLVKNRETLITVEIEDLNGISLFSQDCCMDILVLVDACI